MEKELQIINKLEPILDETITLKMDLVLVNNSKDEQEAKAAIKQIREHKKSYVDKIHPYKSTLHKLHKMVTGKEQENLAIFDEAITKQDIPVKEYNRRVYLEQQEAKRLAEERAKIEEERLRKEAEERIKAEQEKIEAASVESDRDLENKISDLDNLEAEEKCLENIEVTPDKVYSKKDEVKVSYDYFITDEAQFIIWALAHDRNLLNITPNKSEFKRWAKIEGNDKHSFVGVTEKYI